MKHHNNLTDDQIHLPKGFEPASTRSVMTKNTTGGLDWKKANYTSSTTVTCVADVGGSLHHRYFCLYNSNDVVKYAVYFNITGGDAISLPAGYDMILEIDVTASGSGSTAAQVGDALQTTLNAHADFTATDDDAGVVTITGTTSSTDPFNVDTGFTISTVQTKITDELLSTDSTGDISWRGMLEGTEIKSTGEAGGTKFLREDGDGTCSWQTVSGGATNAFSTISCPLGSNPVADSDTDTLNLASGTGITITGNSASDTITIANTVANTERMQDSWRFETNNLATGSGTAYTFQGEHTTKGGMVSVEIDPTDLSAPTALRGMVYIRPSDDKTYTFAHASSVMSGTNVTGGNVVKLKLWKVSQCPEGEAPETLSGTLLAYGDHDTNGNSDFVCANWTLSETEGALTLTNLDTLMFTLETNDAVEDLDVRGMFTFGIKIT